MARRELSRRPPRWSPTARLGLPARFALTLVVAGLPIGVLGTQVIVDRQVEALEATAEDSVRGVLDLLDSSVTNLVAAGDVSGLHDVLGDVRRHDDVSDTFVTVSPILGTLRSLLSLCLPFLAFLVKLSYWLNP